MKTTHIILALALSLCSASYTLASPGNDDEYNSDQKSGAYQLAIAAINHKDYSEAIGHLDGLIKEQPKNADAYNMLGFSHRKMKNYETAERYYHRALTLDPGHKGAMEYLGELYVETQRMEQARELLSKLDKACWLGCKEYDLLKDKIEAAGKN
jgi:Flp pilus assembly protein TadD